MKIFGLLVVKNEADIVCHTLQAAAGWCDEIYVLDNGSEDGTWQLVKQMAQQNATIIAHGQAFEPFSISLRANIFDAYRDRARTGDWWCRLDADEIYVESPRAFLSSVANYDVVWAIHLQYYFTEVDCARYQRDSEKLDASSLSPTDRLRYYLANASEPRFFRHREGLKWEKTDAWPTHLGRVCPRRILVRHYQYRSPPQMQSRFATRSGAVDNSGEFDHWICHDLKSLIRNSSDLHYDSGDGAFVIDEGDLPRHRDSFWRAAIKKFMHGSGLWP
jgi:glycosyltransferase involved in cell wall biosynthesis